MRAKPALRSGRAYLLVPLENDRHQDELHRLLDAHGWKYRTVIAAEPRDAAVLHEAADSLRVVADEKQQNPFGHSPDWVSGIKYAAGLLDRVADDEGTDN